MGYATKWARLKAARAELAAAEADMPRCKAIIHCGAGHQSIARCRMLGPHKVHVSEGREFRWKGMEQFSGFFNESPLLEE